MVEPKCRWSGRIAALRILEALDVLAGCAVWAAAGRYSQSIMWTRGLVDRPVVAREVAESDLRAVVRGIEPEVGTLLLHGLLRPAKILVDGYTASHHRCCPLTAAVWQATGREATRWKEIQAGIIAIGLGEHHHRFYQAFDVWARAYRFERADSDGALVLSAEGRLKLVALVEQEMHARDARHGQRLKRLRRRSSVAA
jgi:hypothetical protein